MKYVCLQRGVDTTTAEAVTKALAARCKDVDITVTVLNRDMCARDVLVEGLALVVEVPVPLERHNDGRASSVPGVTGQLFLRKEKWHKLSVRQSKVVCRCWFRSVHMTDEALKRALVNDTGFYLDAICLCLSTVVAKTVA